MIHLEDVGTEYLEDALPYVERKQFEAHLAECPDCRTYVAQMRQTIHLLGKLTEDSNPGETRPNILELFRDWNMGRNV